MQGAEFRRGTAGGCFLDKRYHEVSRQSFAFHYVTFPQPRGGNGQSRDRDVEYSITSPNNYGNTQQA